MNHVEKCLNLLRVFTVLFFISFASPARTLRELAQNSNALLVQKCGLTAARISAISQKLKAEVDFKIASLKDSDFTLLEKRAKTCDQECTCDIYALALEKKQIQIESLNPKAASLSTQQRNVCASRLQKPCSF